MSWLDRFTRVTDEDSKQTVTVEGTPLPEGTPLVECSFCHSAVPSLSFIEHCRAHQKVQYIRSDSDD